jgi:hypothetical protein
MNLFNPWVILAIVISVVTSFGAGYFKGKHDENIKQQVEIAALNAKARETEKAMVEVATIYSTKLRKANNEAEKQITSLRADLNSGALRLRVPVKTNCAVPAAPNTTFASGTDGETTSAELDAKTSDDLISITAEGDEAIRKLNTCISLYNEAYETLRSKP